MHRFWKLFTGDEPWKKSFPTVRDLGFGVMDAIDAVFRTNYQDANGDWTSLPFGLSEESEDAYAKYVSDLIDVLEDEQYLLHPHNGINLEEFWKWKKADNAPNDMQPVINALSANTFLPCNALIEWLSWRFSRVNTGLREVSHF